MLCAGLPGVRVHVSSSRPIVGPCPVPIRRPVGLNVRARAGRMGAHRVRTSRRLATRGAASTRMTPAGMTTAAPRASAEVQTAIPKTQTISVRTSILTTKVDLPARNSVYYHAEQASPEVSTHSFPPGFVAQGARSFFLSSLARVCFGVLNLTMSSDRGGLDSLPHRASQRRRCLWRGCRPQTSCRRSTSAYRMTAAAESSPWHPLGELLLYLADSTGQRNTFAEHLSGRLEA